MGHVAHLIPAVILSALVLMCESTVNKGDGNSTNVNGPIGTHGQGFACKAAADVIFLLDASARVADEANYQNVVDLAASIVRSFIVGDADVLFGGVTYSDDAKRLFDLKDFKTQEDLTKALKESHLMNTSSRPDLGLIFVGYHEMFSLDLGGRYNAAKLVVVIMAGKSDRADLTKEAAKNLANEGVVIVAAGIGSEVELELVDIASSALNVVKTKSFGQLDHVTQEITSRICEDASIQNITAGLLASDAAFTSLGYKGSTHYPAAFNSLTNVRYPFRAGWTQGRPRPREQILTVVLQTGASRNCTTLFEYSRLYNCNAIGMPADAT